MLFLQKINSLRVDNFDALGIYLSESAKKMCSLIIEIQMDVSNEQLCTN